MEDEDRAKAAGPWQRVIGILGGLGPHAHIELERRLLALVEDPAGDQEYPPWIVASVPETPDRTAALLAGGPSPVPALLRGLARLAGHADFAVIACLTAHAFLDELRAGAALPILDAIEVTVTHLAGRFGKARVGLLATTGTLASGIFQRAGARLAPGLELISPLDLPDGERLAEELVMRPVYGPLHAGRRTAGGVKSGSLRDPETGALHRDTLAAAVAALAAAGAVGVVLGCTEIPLVLGREPLSGAPLFDPLDLAAAEALRIARGERPLP